MSDRVREYAKTLTPITDFATLNKGDKIFNSNSLSIEFKDTFDHIESWSGDREIVFYYNCKGELWNGKTSDYWYYVD